MVHAVFPHHGKFRWTILQRVVTLETALFCIYREGPRRPDEECDTDFHLAWRAHAVVPGMAITYLSFVEAVQSGRRWPLITALLRRHFSPCISGPRPLNGHYKMLDDLIWSFFFKLCLIEADLR